MYVIHMYLNKTVMKLDNNLLQSLVSKRLTVEMGMPRREMYQSSHG